jgi:transcriptional regulator with XRE-family HTH domain
MGQGIGRIPQASAVDGGAGRGREPIGRYIAQQRRLRGIELEELAARTRIPRRSLERLEAGAFDQSPDGFSRGFVRTVAEAIGLDPDDAVARMLPEPDASRRGTPRKSRVLGAFAAAVALVAVALAARQLASLLPARAQRPAHGELPVRRDYVRALAEHQGVATAVLTARDAVLAPLPQPASAAIAEGAARELAGASSVGELAEAPRPTTPPTVVASPPATASPAPRPAAPRAGEPVATASAASAREHAEPQSPPASVVETPRALSAAETGGETAFSGGEDAGTEAPSTPGIPEAAAPMTADAEAHD